MKFKKLRKVLAVLTAWSVILNTAAVPVKAHTGGISYNDYWNGTIGYNVSNLKYFIDPSALNSWLKLNDVYKPVMTQNVGWNKSHLFSPDKVRITAIETTNWTNNHIMVYGDAFTNDMSTTGRIVAYNVYGQVNIPASGVTAGLSGPDIDWVRSVIYIRNTDHGWGTNNSAERLERARYSFIHEVGHSLKLTHPSCRDKAVMQSAALGWPGMKDALATFTIQNHDRWTVSLKHQ